MKKTLIVVTLFTIGLFAQVPTALPDHFAAAGLGYQHSALQKESGWINLCTKVASTERVFACGATDYKNNSSSVRAEIETVVFHRGGLTLAGKGGAGIAIGNTSTGASFSGGGVALYDISKFTKIDNFYFVFSGTLDKGNISVQSGRFGFLKPLGTDTTFRFGFGKAW